MNCLFCNPKKENIVYETDNFYVKVGKAIISAGHVMIIPKVHYLAIGGIDNTKVEEFLKLKEKVIMEVENKFSKPFMIEHGVIFQSVFHAHLHIIPSSGSNYQNVNLLDNFFIPSAKKFNIGIQEIKDFQELKNYYDNYREYLYYEYDNKKYIIKVHEKNNLNKIYFVYRHYFTGIGLLGIKGWKNMSKNDKKIDSLKIKNTKLKLFK